MTDAHFASPKQERLCEEFEASPFCQRLLIRLQPKKTCSEKAQQKATIIDPLAKSDCCKTILLKSHAVVTRRLMTFSYQLFNGLLKFAIYINYIINIIISLRWLVNVYYCPWLANTHVAFLTMIRPTHVA